MKFSALGALAVGYVLGAKAGKERYETIKRVANKTAERLENYGSSGSLATRVEGLGDRNGPRA